MRRTILVVALAWMAACDSDDPPHAPGSTDAGDAGTDAGTGATFGAGNLEDAGAQHPGFVASQLPDGSLGAASDAAASDAASTCDLSHCPDPRPFSNDAQACCRPDGSCGFLLTYDLECRALEDGRQDDDCLDAAFDGGVLEGCCRSDGRCGHSDPRLGCHDLLTLLWSRELTSCDGNREPDPPQPFMCTGLEQPCAHDWECCTHYNYDTQCSVARGADAGPVCNTCPDC